MTTTSELALGPGLDQELTGFVEAQIRAAFHDDEEIREMALDYFGDEHDPELVEARIDPVMLQVRQRLQAEQASWPAVTDNDRLDAAFAALEERGIVARQNFTCCQSCGHGEIGMEAGADHRGYTFYHMQDTDSAVEGYGLYLAYGVFEGDDATFLQIAQEIVETLREHDLEVQWDGTTNQRILVQLRWQRRVA